MFTLSFYSIICETVISLNTTCHYITIDSNNNFIVEKKRVMKTEQNYREVLLAETAIMQYHPVQHDKGPAVLFNTVYWLE